MERSFLKYSCKDTLKSLDYRQTSIKIGKGKVCINSTALFTRLAAVSKREVKVEYFFLLWNDNYTIVVIQKWKDADARQVITSESFDKWTWV